jgi:uncharacterized protein (DUF2141 family)
MVRRNARTLTALVAAAQLTGVLVAADAAAQPPPGMAKIVVRVGTFRNRNGALGCRLFSGPKEFLQSSAAEKRVAITGGVTECTFENVPPGTYAVAVMHDENDNHKLDKNFLGIPTEGYGVSNNRTYAMSGPKWEESKFVVEAGKDVALDIGLRY